MRTLLAAAALATMAGFALAPAQAAPFAGPSAEPVARLASWNWPLPEFGAATTFRHDEADHDVRHYPSCTGLTSGTAHRSCGSLTGGPAGGLN